MNKINENTPMAFGIYRGIKLKDVPSHYLIYIYENNKSGRYTDYIESKIEALKADEKEKLGNG